MLQKTLQVICALLGLAFVVGVVQNASLRANVDLIFLELNNISLPLVALGFFCAGIILSGALFLKDKLNSRKQSRLQKPSKKRQDDKIPVIRLKK